MTDCINRLLTDRRVQKVTLSWLSLTSQLVHKPLTSNEFLTTLAKFEPTYKEEFEKIKVERHARN